MQTIINYKILGENDSLIREGNITVNKAIDGIEEDELITATVFDNMTEKEVDEHWSLDITSEIIGE